MALEALRAEAASPADVTDDDGKRACRVAFGISQCAVIARLETLRDARLAKVLQLLPPAHAAALRMHFVFLSYAAEKVERAVRKEPAARDLGLETFVLYRADSVVGASMATMALVTRYDELEGLSIGVVNIMRAITNGIRLDDLNAEDDVRKLWQAGRNVLTIACKQKLDAVSSHSVSVVDKLRPFLDDESSDDDDWS